MTDISPASTAETASEQALAARAAGGDETAFRTLVDRCGGAVFAAARRITGDGDEAEDVAQEAFVRLYRAFCGGDTVPNPKAWLIRVAVNLAIDRVRAENRHPGTSYENVSGMVQHTGPTPDAAAEERETLAVIRTLAAELPDRQAAVFILRDMEGRSTAEISGLLDCAESTVRVHLARARLSLRTLVQQRYPHLLPTGGTS